MTQFFKLASASILAGVLLSACGGGSKDPFLGKINEVGMWVMSAEEKTRYAKLDPPQARIKFVQDKFQAEAATLPSAADRKALAAAIYTNYAMLQNRAIPDYCAGMNVDISNFQTEFDRSNSRENKALEDFLSTQGKTLDGIWSGYAGRMKRTAKNELMAGGSSFSTCRTLQKDPGKAARYIAFSKLYPRISATLKQTL